MIRLVNSNDQVPSADSSTRTATLVSDNNVKPLWSNKTFVFLFFSPPPPFFLSVGKNRRVLKTPLPLFHATRPLPWHKRKADTKNAMAHLP